MAEFNITSFANSIKQNLYDNFPYESDDLTQKKHAKRPLHIRDIAFMWLPSTESNGTILFDIGSDYAEENYPYYHILQDAEVIRKRGKGTKLSKGSQVSVERLSDRDYGRIRFNGKTYSREYNRNVRGERSRTQKATYNIVGSDGKVYQVNKNASYYKNKHFHYIERILDTTLPWIASENGLRMGRTQITGLEQEYSEQEENNLITKIIKSFEE